MSSYSIYAVPAGRGEIGIGPMPGIVGGYAADLATILAWAPAVCLTMAEQRELEMRGAGALVRDLAAQGCDWHHLPIRDFGAPSERTALLWPAASAAAHAALDAGGRVLTHCRGGCGRSGMAALRLLVERGEDPQAALDRLRAARPCAVETKAQFTWAARGA